MLQKVLSYSLCQPIEMTRLCASACQFCPYPYTAHDPLMPLSKIRKIIKFARKNDADMIILTGGEEPDVYPETQHNLEYYGFHNFMDYLVKAAALAQFPTEKNDQPLPAMLDIGPLKPPEWKPAQNNFSIVRLLLTSADNEVIQAGALADAPTQNPDTRINALVLAGEAGVPLATGTMVGIGESPLSREKAIRILAAAAKKYGNIRSFLVQAFRPHPATPMAEAETTRLAEATYTVELARHFLPASVRIQINALDWPDKLSAFVEAGVNDLGDLNLEVLGKKGKNRDQEIDLILQPLREQGYEIRQRHPRVHTMSQPVRKETPKKKERPHEIL